MRSLPGEAEANDWLMGLRSKGGGSLLTCYGRYGTRGVEAEDEADTGMPIGV